MLLRLRASNPAAQSRTRESAACTTTSDFCRPSAMVRRGAIGTAQAHRRDLTWTSTMPGRPQKECPSAKRWQGQTQAPAAKDVAGIGTGSLWKARYRITLVPANATTIPAIPPSTARHNAFRKGLPDQRHAGSSQRRPHRRLLLPVGGPHQHQVGQVGAGNQQDEARNPHQQVQSVLILVSHHLHAVAAVREVQHLLGHQGLIARPLLCSTGSAKIAATAPAFALPWHWCLRRDECGRSDPANRVRPPPGSCPLGEINGSSLRGMKKAGGVLCTRSPKKPGGVMPTTVNGWPLITKPASDHGGVLAELFLPGPEAHHGHGRRALPVVVRHDRPPEIGKNAEGREVIAGDEFALVGLGWLIAAVAANANHTLPGLKGGQLREAGGLRPETACIARRRRASNCPACRR